MGSCSSVASTSQKDGKLSMDGQVPVSNKYRVAQSIVRPVVHGCKGNALADIEDLASRNTWASVTSSKDDLNWVKNLRSSPSTRPLYRSRDIRNVHMELTTQCNAACPQCSRNDQGGKVNPLLAQHHAELSVEDVKRILPEEFLKQLKKVYFCGNFGDPAVARDCFEVLEYVRSVDGGPRVGLFTNGGMRTPEWWSKLGKVMQPADRAFVRFAIDGDESTNHLYRQNVIWDRLMLNVQAFLAAGGHAEWDFLVFEHNEHQVEDLRALAESLGFTKFTAKKTARFLDRPQGRIKESTPVKDSNGQVVRSLRPPRSRQWQNEALVVDAQTTIARYGSMDAYYDSCQVSCKIAKEKEVYISAEGFALPCCWLAGEVLNFQLPESKMQFKRLLYAAEPEQGMQAYSALVHGGVAGVVDRPGGIFDKLVPAAMSQSSVATGRLRTCSQVCGTAVSAFKKQFEGAAMHIDPALSQKPVLASNVAEKVDDDSPPSPVLIWYGSETGNAERLAHIAAESLGASAEVAPCPAVPGRELLKGRLALILVIATWGNGEPTDDALPLFTWLEQCAKHQDLKGSTPPAAVYGLGSSEWPHFNAAARRATKLLGAAGASLLLPHAEGDAAKGQIDPMFIAWLGQELVPSLKTRGVSALSGPPRKVARAITSPHLSDVLDLSVVSCCRLAPGDPEAVYCELELAGPLVYSSADAIGILPPPPASMRSEGAHEQTQGQRRPRWYTAASCPSAANRNLRLVIREVPTGSCSPWLCNLAAGAQVQCLPPRRQSQLTAAINAFPDAPVLMVANGAGVAPFLALLERRRLSGQAFEKPWVLFMGCRTGGDGLVHSEQLNALYTCGALASLVLAESRPTGGVGRYVQTALEAEISEISTWLQPTEDVHQGAVVLVCGSVAMGVGVRNVIASALSKIGGRVEDLEAEGRYAAELW